MAFMYVDGSSKKVGKHTYEGYGVVLVVGDEMMEFSSGCVSTSKVQYHEHWAFLKGLTFAQSLGVCTKSLRVYCDDALFGNASFFLHDDNRSPMKEKVLATLDAMGCNDVERSLLLQTLQHGNYVKLKGHKQEVYQERVDYLAKFTARFLSGESTEFLPYDQWLSMGFKQFDKATNSMVVYYPPFVKM